LPNSWTSLFFRIEGNWMKKRLTLAVLVIAVAILVFGKIYIIRDDSGGNLLWNSNEAYLFMDVKRRGFEIRYLEYPWVMIKESLYGVRLPDDQRTTVTVVHITASGVERHVVEASDEEQANTPDFYTPLQGYIYANCEGFLCRWTGNKFETAIEEEQRRLGGTDQLIEKNMEKGWFKRGFAEGSSNYEFAVDVDGKFSLQVTNKVMDKGSHAMVSVGLVRPGQTLEDIWNLDARPRWVGRTEYKRALEKPR
jgi:hypothetical protein